jgi:hypothetical protein
MPYTNKRNLSLPVAVWLANDTYDKDPSYISGSQLAQSDRQIVLGYRVNEQSVDLSSLVAARLGHAINDAIDNAWKSPGFNGRILSGAPDLIMNGRLTDYKSTSVFAWQKKETGDYLWQLTTYRYLARELISDDTATIQFILKDWSELRASKDPEYPQTPCPVMLVRVGSPAECLARITARIERLKALMLLDQSELPTCSDDELWLDPPKFAYYKDAFADGKGRATRVFDTEAEAIQFMGTKLGAGKIITRKGEPKACNYCEAATICSQRASWNT